MSAEARVEALAADGRRCTLVDASGDGIAAAELARLLAELIQARAFGFRASGRTRLALDAPHFAHVQLGDRLYRLSVRRREARLERF